MLARYQIVRGRRSADDPLPEGTRIDVRKHTRHVLAPTAAMVDTLLKDPADPARAADFRERYLALLEERHAADPRPFDELAARAENDDVYIGCSCPTRKQPDVQRCHTVLALRFMAEKYPDLRIVEP